MEKDKKYKAFLQVLVFKTNVFETNTFLKKGSLIMDYFIDDLLKEENVEIDSFLKKVKEELKLDEKTIKDEIEGIKIFLKILICFLKNKNYDQNVEKMKNWKEKRVLANQMDIMKELDVWFENNRDKIL